MKKRLAFVIALVVIAVAIVAVFLGLGQQDADTEITKVTEAPVAEETPEITEAPTEEPAVVESVAVTDFISDAVANGRRVERTTTFSADVSTGEESVDQVISALLDALSIVTYTQEANGNQSGLRVSMDGNDILYCDFAEVDGKLYLRSDLLADDTVVVEEGDGQTIAENLIMTLKAEGILDEATADSALEQLKAALSGASNPMADVDFEAVLNGFDFTALQALAEGFAEKVEQGDPSGQPEGSDPAIMAVTIKMTAEDIVKVYDIIFDAMKANKEYLAMLDTMVVSVEGEKMSAEDAVNTMQEKINTLLPEMVDGEIPLTLYLNGDDEVVAATLDFTMKAATEEGGDPETVKADFTYWRQTAEEQTNHSMVYTISGESMQATMNADVALKADGTVNAKVSFEADGNVIAFTFAKDEQVGETEKKSNIDFAVAYSENGGDAVNVRLNVETTAKKDGADAEQTTIVTLSLNDAKLATMTTVSKTGDPVESISTDDAIRLAEKSQEEFQSWFEGLIGNLQMWAIKALQSLPQEVLLLMMN